MISCDNLGVPKAILIVDDDPDFRSSLAFVLAEAGYACLEAADGEAALRLLETRHREIALALVDLCIPKVSGFEVIGAITRREPAPIRVVAMSATFRDEYMEMAKYMGAAAALRKPPAGERFPAHDLLITVRRVLGEPITMTA